MSGRRLSDRGWSYGQLAEKARATILRYRRRAASLRKQGDTYGACIHEQWAYGAFMLWADTTEGWREQGDYEAMRQLAEGETDEQFATDGDAAR